MCMFIFVFCVFITNILEGLMVVSTKSDNGKTALTKAKKNKIYSKIPPTAYFKSLSLRL